MPMLVPEDRLQVLGTASPSFLTPPFLTCSRLRMNYDAPEKEERRLSKMLLCGAGEKVQEAKCFLCEHEALCLDYRTLF